MLKKCRAESNDLGLNEKVCNAFVFVSLTGWHARRNLQFYQAESTGIPTPRHLVAYNPKDMCGKRRFRLCLLPWYVRDLLRWRDRGPREADVCAVC